MRMTSTIGSCRARSGGCHELNQATPEDLAGGTAVIKGGGVGASGVVVLRD
jgi:hypothetical protein